MSAKNPAIGDRIKAKSPTIGGWKGSGTIVGVDEELMIIAKDGPQHCDLVARAFEGHNLAPWSGHGIVTLTRSEVTITKTNKMLAEIMADLKDYKPNLDWGERRKFAGYPKLVDDGNTRRKPK